jgi:hypothetical protein
MMSQPAHESAPASASTAAPRAGGACELDQQALMQCLNAGNASNCDFYFNALQSCQSNSN